MSEQAIGRCSICGGVVKVHVGLWMGLHPPVPTCTQCGATKAECPDRIIPMNGYRSALVQDHNDKDFLDELTKRAN